MLVRDVGGQHEGQHPSSGGTEGAKVAPNQNGNLNRVIFQRRHRIYICKNLLPLQKERPGILVKYLFKAVWKILIYTLCKV